jgi:hypothetical protein
MQAVSEENAQSKNMQQGNMQSVNGKVPETTKQIMEAVNNSQKQGNKNSQKVG